MSAPTYQAVIVGAGRIVAGYDAPGDERILTHAHALASQPRIRCAGLYDPDTARAEAAATKWGLRAARSVEELLSIRPALVIIASPDEAHLECLEQALAARPRLVICEKPLTPSLVASERIVARYEREGVPLAINYQRRFDPVVAKLKRRLAAGETGRTLAGCVLYSKGVLHNGSHAVDLLRHLLGEVREARGRRKVGDFTDADPSVAGTLRFDAAEIEMIAVDERAYSTFEIDLLFERERIRFTHSGLEFERHAVRPDPMFPGYVQLTRVESGPTGLATALREMLLAEAAFLDGTAPLLNAARDALETQRACARLLESAP